jgi:hypothetical protein
MATLNHYCPGLQSMFSNPYQKSLKVSVSRHIRTIAKSAYYHSYARLFGCPSAIMYQRGSSWMHL